MCVRCPYLALWAWGAGLHRGALTMIVGGWLPVLLMAIFTLSKTHSLSWRALLDRIGNFALVSLLLVMWLTFWGFVRRKHLRRTHDPRPVPALLLRDHAATFGIPPETIERWRQSQIVVVHFDAANRLENVTAKAPSLP